MHEPVDGRSKITGILLKPEEGVLKIEEKNGEVFRVGKDEVAHIRLKVIL